MKPSIAVPPKGRFERGSNNGLGLGGEASYASPTPRPVSLSSLKHDALRGLNGNDSLYNTMTVHSFHSKAQCLVSDLSTVAPRVTCFLS
jgi:hypothetical protein